MRSRRRTDGWRTAETANRAALWSLPELVLLSRRGPNWIRPLRRGGPSARMLLTERSSPMTAVGPMGGAKRQNRTSSTIRKPPSQTTSGLSASAPPLARVTLPSDLPGSLKCLDDAQLRRLLDAVTVEINRRNQGDAKKKEATPALAETLAKRESVPVSYKTTSAIDEIPEGKANLIRASFRAGIKPLAIARTFRISQSLVNRVLNSIEKPKR